MSGFKSMPCYRGVDAIYDVAEVFSWELVGISGGNCGNVGSPWELLGALMGISWEYHGYVMDLLYMI